MKTISTLALAIIAAATVRADITLTPSYTVRAPVGHEYALSLIFDPEMPQTYGYGTSGVVLITTTEAWALHDSMVLSRIFDPNFAGVRMFEESLAYYDRTSQTYTFSGGLLDARIYNFSMQTMSLTAQGALMDLIDIPAGFAIRGTTGELFAASRPFGGNDYYQIPPRDSALYRYSPVTGDTYGTIFGNTGPGAVSNEVGAVLFGPDGRLNVLDVGRQEILRYDPDTLEFLDAISLVSTTTDKTSFAISSTGYIFTTNTDTTSGGIYDYLTGDYVGTFEGMAEGREPGRGGKLAMTADDAGNVYVTNSMVSAYLSVFSTSTIPEPSTIALFIGGSVAAFVALRRRRK